MAGRGQRHRRAGLALLTLATIVGLTVIAGGAPSVSYAQTPTDTPTNTSTPTVTLTPTFSPTPSITPTPNRTVQPGVTAIPIATATPVPGATGTPRPAGTAPTGATPAAPSGPVQARITYPPQGQIINTQPFLLMIEISGIRLDASRIGTPSRPGEGHWLLLVDDVPVASGDALQFSMGNVPEGLHTLTVQVRNNDRSPLTPPVETSTFINIGGVAIPFEPGDDQTPGELPVVPGGLPRTGNPGAGAAGPAALMGAALAVLGLNLRRWSRFRS